MPNVELYDCKIGAILHEFILYEMGKRPGPIT